MDVYYTGSGVSVLSNQLQVRSRRIVRLYVVIYGRKNGSSLIVVHDSQCVIFPHLLHKLSIYIALLSEHHQR